jgi:hypothetical protein
VKPSIFSFSRSLHCCRLYGLTVECNERFTWASTAFFPAAKCVGSSQSHASAPREDHAIPLRQDFGCHAPQPSVHALKSVDACTVNANRILLFGDVQRVKGRPQPIEVLACGSNDLKACIFRVRVSISIIDGDVDKTYAIHTGDHLRSSAAATPVQIQNQNGPLPCRLAIAKQGLCCGYQAVERTPKAGASAPCMVHATAERADDPYRTAVPLCAVHFTNSTPKRVCVLHSTMKYTATPRLSQRLYKRAGLSRLNSTNVSQIMHCPKNVFSQRQRSAGKHELFFKDFYSLTCLSPSLLQGLDDPVALVDRAGGVAFRRFVAVQTRHVSRSIMAQRAYYFPISLRKRFCRQIAGNTSHVGLGATVKHDQQNPEGKVQ